MVLRTSVVLTVLVLCGLVCVYAADVSGKWTAEFESGVGPQKYIYELKVEDGKITGKASVNVGGADMESKITEGTVEGDKVSFVESLDYQGMPLTISYKGTISGDEMKLERDVGGQSDGIITLKRAK
jgi:hypothetical protein